MRCGAVGRDRSPPWAFPFVSIPCCKIARSAIPNRVPRFTLCAPSRSLWRRQPNAAARLIGGRAIRSESIDIGVAVEAQDGIMVPVIRNADKTSLADLTSRYTELVDLARRRRRHFRDDLRRDRVGFEFRHVRPRMGHADSPARSDTAARPRRRKKSADVEMRRSSSSFRRHKPN